MPVTYRYVISGSRVCRTSLPKNRSNQGDRKSRTSTGGRNSKLASKSRRLMLLASSIGVELVGVWLSE